MDRAGTDMSRDDWQVSSHKPTSRQRDYAEALLDKLQEAGEDIYDLRRRYDRCKTISEMSDLIDDLKSLWDEVV